MNSNKGTENAPILGALWSLIIFYCCNQRKMAIKYGLFLISYRMLNLISPCTAEQHVRGPCHTRPYPLSEDIFTRPDSTQIFYYY